MNPHVGGSMSFTDEQLDAGARYLPAVMGCICSWDEHGNPPASCRCAERSRRLARENVREIVTAVLEAAQS